MKIPLCLLCAILFISWQSNNVSIYQLAFTDITGMHINMSSFKGKKIVIAELDADNPDLIQLSALDTLYKKNKNNMVVIAIPISDFDNVSSDSHTKNLWKDTLELSYIVSKLSKASKNNGNAQHPLLQWLTDKNKNGHIDKDVTTTGEMFVISETGKLFAIFRKKINPNGSLMNKILQQNVP